MQAELGVSLNDDASTSCYTLSSLLASTEPGHNTRFQLCLWDINIFAPFSSFLTFTGREHNEAHERMIKAPADMTAHRCFAFHSSLCSIQPPYVLQTSKVQYISVGDTTISLVFVPTLYELLTRCGQVSSFVSLLHSTKAEERIQM